MIDRTRIVNGRKCKMVIAPKQPTKEAAEKYAVETLNMTDFEVTSTGKTTWRVYTPMEPPVQKTPRAQRRAQKKAEAKMAPVEEIENPDDYWEDPAAIKAAEEEAAVEEAEEREVEQVVTEVPAAEDRSLEGWTDVILANEEDNKTGPDEIEPDEDDDDFDSIFEEEPIIEEPPEPADALITETQNSVEFINNAPVTDITNLGKQIITTIRKVINSKTDDFAEAQEVAVELGKKINSVTGALGKLIEKGYISTHQVEAGSTVTIHLTEKGWRANLS
ncbi:MAG: hypothetical protein WC346_09715 [Methanogenium sp.]|jgi:DNA-binding MarR family transcriptional regulator